ncbi:MAG: transcriptional regulator [Candidatus Bathyarchaeia archaeon]|jgi:predicted transcriptional regulator
MFKEEILENERRSKIYFTLKKSPGLHIRELSRIMGIPVASLQHHLIYMAQRSVIIEEKTGHYTRYYCTPLDDADKKVLSVLRHKRLREIVMMIMLNKKAKYRFIVQSLELPTSSVSLYLKYLFDNGIVERTKIGYENIYTLKNEERIEKVLSAYQSSLLDAIVDKWTSTWLENRSIKQKKKAKKPEEEP